MINILPRGDRSMDRPLVTWRDRCRVAEVRTQAQIVEFWEYAEAAHLDTRLLCAGRLADRAANELVVRHQRMTELAAGDAAMELDLRDLERVLKIGFEHLLDDYLNGR